MNDRPMDEPIDPTTELPLGPRPVGPPPPPASPYGGPYPAPGALSPGAAAPAPSRRGAGRGRSRFAAGVVAAALVAGGAAGVGGAAAWSALEDEPAATSSTGTPVRSQVVDSPDTPAAEGSVEAVAATVLPSVVKIDVVGAQGAGSGSGIVLSSDGQILTNDHVVELAAEGGGEISVSFNDGTKAEAEVVGTDPLTDVAVIQAKDVSGLTPATLGKSSDLAVGEGVIAIGSPFGLDATVTSGIVSALNRPVEVGRDADGNTTAYPAIQTDAAINPGNSGGALVDMNGHVVGINSSIQTTGSGSPFGQAEGGSIGLGFAIPIDTAMPIVEQLLDGEEPTHARLGITIADAQGRSGEEAVEGARVEEVGKGSAADEAGLEPGDVITKIDEHHVTGSDALIATIRSYRPGDEVTVTYLRDGESRTVDVTLDSDEDTSRS